MFHRHVEGSLKSRTRHKRTSGNEIRYQVTDITSIEYVTLKQFLSHIETKQDLAVYLSNYVIKEFDAINVKYTVTYDLQSESKIDTYADEMKHHDHREADTLLVLQAIDIARNDPFTECVIYSPDTDVFLLLVNYSQSLPQVNYYFKF